MTGLKGKAAFVTGAASGIGRASAHALAREGVNLMLIDIDEAGLEQTRASIERLGVRAAAAVVDLSDAVAVAKAFAKAVDIFGRVQLAHNNAGILGPHAPLADYPLADAHRLFDVNVFGVLHCLQPQIRHMVEQGGGSIVNTASIASVRVSPQIGVYAATKHAVMGLTKAVACEYGAQGIRANCVCPSITITNMTKELDEAARAERAAYHPIGRLGQPEEVAEAVIWLLSDKASFSTGSAMFIDGGYTI